MFDTIYDDARRRVCDLAAGLSPEQLDTTVPGTPEWTARQLVAHLTGVATDAVAGRIQGVPGPEWTSRQVVERADHPLDDVLAEWARAAPEVRAGLSQRRLSVRMVLDVLTHEADLREAFTLGPLPAEVVEAVLPVVAEPVVRGAAGRLVVHAGEHTWEGGEGEPTTLTVEPYELFRGLISRRSRAQMRAWEWAGDTERHVDALPAFGPRDDDQPLP